MCAPEDSEVLRQLAAVQETVWLPHGPAEAPDLDPSIIDDAEDRFRRFAPLFAKQFPETRMTGGILEGPLECFSNLHAEMKPTFSAGVGWNLWAKRDDLLPVSGSIKSRGGIHEVLETAERWVTEAGLMGENILRTFAREDVRELLAQYRLVVGSTGNLGLSIGLSGRALGIQVSVHMAAEAKQWKKDMLREVGAEVIEHDQSFTAAVAEGRSEAEADPQAHFVDDENSLSLFAGYAVAGRRLAGQLRSLSISVSPESPLFVYLPCGIGGAPGGVTFGLKHELGDAVRCFFVEPTHAPAVFLGRLTGKDAAISVHDIGVDGRTVADGLAVAQPSELVGRHMGGLIDGFVTVSDENMLRMVSLAHKAEGAQLEPSACAGLMAIRLLGKALESDTSGRTGVTREAYEQATHVAWLTGGSMVPEQEVQNTLNQGLRLGPFR